MHLRYAKFNTNLVRIKFLSVLILKSKPYINNTIIILSVPIAESFKVIFLHR